jgi:hypothetical protein
MRNEARRGVGHNLVIGAIAYKTLDRVGTSLALSVRSQHPGGVVHAIRQAFPSSAVFLVPG